MTETQRPSAFAIRAPGGGTAKGTERSIPADLNSGLALVRSVGVATRHHGKPAVNGILILDEGPIFILLKENPGGGGSII